MAQLSITWNFKKLQNLNDLRNSNEKILEKSLKFSFIIKILEKEIQQYKLSEKKKVTKQNITNTNVYYY